MIGPDVALAICRMTQFASAMFVFGTGGFVCAVAPPRLGADIAGQLRRPIAAAAGFGLLAAAAWLPLEAGNAGGGWGGAGDATVLSAILFDTSIGHVWAVQAASSLLLAGMAARRPQPPGGLVAASALLLGALALSGHAVMRDGLPGAVLIANHALHLFASAAWVGALVPVLSCLAVLADPLLRTEAAVALRRFSSLGHVAVALAIATGIGNTILVLRRWPTHWSSPYQLLLAAKIVLVAGMTGLALVNRYVLVPRLAHDARAVGMIRRHTITALVLAAGVLALVSAFAQLDPT